LPAVVQFHFTPERYCEWVREDVPAYDELQEQVARATEGIVAARVLELGTGTGETARRVLERHPETRLTGIDASARMLERARAELPAARVEELTVARLEDALPPGPFELVFSALAVHHLDRPGKSTLFARVAGALADGGRFVLGDVIVPERPEDVVTPLSPEFDRPDSAENQVAWLKAAGFRARIAWQQDDLAVLVGDLC
jgi:tRNA (cmo5U34)-methyltransferase